MVFFGQVLDKDLAFFPISRGVLGSKTWKIWKQLTKIGKTPKKNPQKIKNQFAGTHFSGFSIFRIFGPKIAILRRKSWKIVDFQNFQKRACWAILSSVQYWQRFAMRNYNNRRSRIVGKDLIQSIEIERFLGGGISPCKDVMYQLRPRGEILFCNKAQ